MLLSGCSWCKLVEGAGLELIWRCWIGVKIGGEKVSADLKFSPYIGLGHNFAVLRRLSGQGQTSAGSYGKRDQFTWI